MQTVHATHIAQSFVALPSIQPRITAAEAKPLSVSLPYRHKIRVTNIEIHNSLGRTERRVLNKFECVASG